MVDQPMGQGSSGITDVVTQLNSIARNQGQLYQLFQNLFPRVFGSFTLVAAPTTTVTQPNVTAGATVLLTPTNAAAANRPIYLSSNAPGASFTVATGNGAAAAGTETYNYVVVNPA
jgi:hypothetical protein